MKEEEIELKGVSEYSGIIAEHKEDGWYNKVFENKDGKLIEKNSLGLQKIETKYIEIILEGINDGVKLLEDTPRFNNNNICTYVNEKIKEYPENKFTEMDLKGNGTLYQPIVKEYLKLEKEYNDLLLEGLKKTYVFIIDEINRGEISKIFGELFYSIDPLKRGEEGKVRTQYRNIHEDPDEYLYIPDNVYIIGTMNDIDRSVDNMDFAMRRRFAFIEITAEESAENMGINEVYKVFMKDLNEEIENNGLSSDYHIGASYFKEGEELRDIWEYRLKPLLKDYFRGDVDREEEINKFIEDKYSEILETKEN